MGGLVNVRARGLGGDLIGQTHRRPSWDRLVRGSKIANNREELGWPSLLGRLHIQGSPACGAPWELRTRDTADLPQWTPLSYVVPAL